MIRIRAVARGVIAALVLSFSFAPATASAEEVVSGVVFSQQAGQGDEALGLCAAGLLRWKRIIKAYAAALYRDDCSESRPVLDDVAKRLELSYFRGFTAEQFGGAADAILERTFERSVLAPLRARIADMHAAYQPVKAGDRYALTYRPGTGTELALNGKRLALVPGADFAAAYFAIWLGPDPADEGLKRRLLEPNGR